MRVDPYLRELVQTDVWLEGQCRAIVAAGQELAAAVGEVNHRMEQAMAGALGRRQRITDSHLRRAETACETLLEVRRAVQNCLFDCEHELRELREREVGPAELLLEGDRLIGQYRFYRRRARVLDGLLAYLPAVHSYATLCLDQLRSIRDGGAVALPLTVPDCGFAQVALEQLGEPAAGER